MMQSQEYAEKTNTFFPRKRRYVLFCQALVVNDLNPFEPRLEPCGVGYQRRQRKIHKKEPLCTQHLRDKIMRERWSQ